MQSMSLSGTTMNPDGFVVVGFHGFATSLDRDPAADKLFRVGVFCPPTYIPRFAALTDLASLLLSRCRHDYYHPADAETVLHHTETRRPKGLGQWHFYPTAVRQRGEDAIGVRFIGDRDGKGKAFEFHFACGTPVRGHDGRLADAEAAVHDLIFETGWKHAWRCRFRTVFKAHHHLHLRAQCFAVEFDCFLTFAIEEQVGLNDPVVLCAHNVQ